MKLPASIVASITLCAVAACGGDSTSPPVTLTAHVVHGPEIAAGVSAMMHPAVSGPSFSATPSNGHWYISPDQGKITIVSLTFHDTAGGAVNASMNSCTATYSRGSVTLSSILDCPFTVRAGKYVGLDIGVSNAFQVLINDATHGIYTDPNSSTGLTSTPPAAGAGFVTLTIPVSAGSGNVMTTATGFDAPLVIAPSASCTGTQCTGVAPPSITLIVDMVHTVLMNVNGSSLTFDTSLPQPAVHVTPTLSGPGRVEFYSATGTADNVNAGLASTGNESTSIRVTYNSSGVPIDIWSPVIGPSEAWNATPTAGATLFTIGGYLGLDATGTLCWALPTTYTYSQYAYLKSMAPVTTIGGTTVLKSKSVTTAPSPNSGTTYTSGCPSFTPDNQTTLTLVAH